MKQFGISEIHVNVITNVSYMHKILLYSYYKLFPISKFNLEWQILTRVNISIHFIAVFMVNCLLENGDISNDKSKQTTLQNYLVS